MTTPKSSWRRRLLTGFLFYTPVVYLAIGFALTVMQRQLLFWPVKTSLAEAGAAAAEFGMQPWWNPAHGLIGWKLPGGPAAAGCILLVHGTDGCALDRRLVAATMRRATGLSVYILEYPGYGARRGSPGEKSFLAAADEAWQNLPPHAPVYIVSESLGAGVAAHLAQRHPAAVSGLLMFVPYDRLTAVAQQHLPLLPVSLLLWDRFAPADWLRDYRGPVKMVVAGADWVIPPQSGRKLYDGYPGRKSLQIIPGVGHAQTMEQTIAWWQEVLAFWQSPPAPAAARPGN